MTSKQFSRREFLRMGGIAAAGVVFAQCACCEQLSALISTPTPTETPTPPPTKTPPPTSTPTPTDIPIPVPPPPPEPVEIRWFIGLGTGTIEGQQDAEYAWTSAFNAQQDEIELELEIIENDVAYDKLQVLIAAGDAPDVVGPVGVRGMGEFYGIWLDLEDHLGAYDMGDFNRGAVDVWRIPGQGLVGLPPTVYPSALYVNNDLFDDARLDYPPQDYADGGGWTIEALEDLAKVLTVDGYGNDAYSSAFDPDDVAQFGFHVQWSDARGLATLFGAGSFVDDDGVTARCPDHWRDAFRFYHRAMWEDHFMPNGPYQVSDMLDNGNPFGSGNVAMTYCHLWYTCCLWDVPNWDYGIVPSVDGQVTCKLHTDMIGVLQDSLNPGAAVKMIYIIANTIELVSLWGGLPAVGSLQAGFLAALDDQFPQGVNWDTIVAGLDYVDIPNHESWMPDLARSNDRIWEFTALLNEEADIDVDAEIDELVADLQDIFDRA